MTYVIPNKKTRRGLIGNAKIKMQKSKLQEN